MHPFPHLYQVVAQGGAEGEVALETDHAPSLASTPPPQFGGPEGYWSPESLLVAAVADCFILSFRAIARASRFEWQHLNVEVEGVLDKDDNGIVRFVRLEICPTLTIAADGDEDKAQRLLEKAEKSCLITNSMKAEVNLETEVRISTSA